MRTEKRTIYLGLLFSAAVLVPAVILSIISLRAVSREEVFIEKRLEKTFLAEVTHTSFLIKNELKAIEDELDKALAAALAGSASDPGLWKNYSSLVRFSFFLSSQREMISPRAIESLSSEERAFLEWGRAFFSGSITVPVYQNIAVVYKKAILDEAAEERPQADFTGGIGVEGVKHTAPAQTRNTLSFDSAQSSSYEQDYLEQEAISRFDREAPVRKKVYEQAKISGRQVLMRKVAFKEKGLSKEEKELQQGSMFITEPARFSDLAQKTDSGLIPRFINDSLHLLFWKKHKDGSIACCLIDQDLLKKRLTAVLPLLYSEARILTLLDEKGAPLAVPVKDKEREWRKPFVAREISELLPHWEAAVYLADPGLISSQARFYSLLMWLLIAILFVSILAGGTRILGSLNTEMRLARQKTTFVANVSHELKTPLTSIRLFAEMLKTKRQTDEVKQEKYLSLMVSETERLTRLINNVLDFSRRDKKGKAYSMEETDLCSLCREIIEGQRLRLEHNGFKVNIFCEPEQIVVKADPEALKQTLVNLLSNAEKYSPDSKEIDIDVKSLDAEAVIRIKDRGMGIPQAQAHKIFDEFFRVDESLTAKTGGTGLGLTIARQIIEDHCGQIRYLPRDNGGSVFEITLPLAH